MGGDDRQRAPRGRRVERRLVAVAVVLTLFYGGGLLSAAFLPILARDNPALLLLLQPTNAIVLLVGARVDFRLLLAITVLRRVASHLLFFLLGSWYGERAVGWVEGRSGAAHGLIKVVEGLFARVGLAIVAVFPGPVPSVLAGASRMRWWVFAAVDLAGTTLGILVVRFAGSLASRPIGAVGDFIDRNATWLTVVFVAATALWLLVQRLRGRTVGALLGSLGRSLAVPADGQRGESEAGGDARPTAE